MKHLIVVALSVLGLCVVAQPLAVHAAAQKAAKSMSATGTVKSVSGSSLVVSAAGKDMSFTLDGSTKFVGKGLSTKSKGAPMSATDAVHEGDHVSVSYHDMGGMMHAASVRVTSSTMMKTKTKK
jgi:hypothetical protein